MKGITFDFSIVKYRLLLKRFFDLETQSDHAAYARILLIRTCSVIWLSQCKKDVPLRGKVHIELHEGTVLNTSSYFYSTLKIQLFGMSARSYK